MNQIDILNSKLVSSVDEAYPIGLITGKLGLCIYYYYLSRWEEKVFLANQSMNIYDFGKINIMPDGDIYANINHPALGKIQTHSIYDIISKELEEGKSWLRIRNQAPCSTCIYQWHCPSPSDYEIEIGRSNLCYVKP